MSRDGGDFFNTTEIYDPESGTFEAGPTMRTRRAGHTATTLSDGRILLTGGLGYLKSAELFDPRSGQFVRTGGMADGRIGHTATLLLDGRVLVVGGELRPSAEVFDPLTGTFAPTGDMSAPRVWHTATLLDDGRVLIVGGHRGRVPEIEVFRSAEIYNPQTGAFAPTDSMAVPRHHHEAVKLEDGRVLVMGGSNERDRAGRYRSAEIYDPATGSFEPVGDLSAPRFRIQNTGLRLPGGRALVAGGADRVEVFNPRTSDFSQAAGVLGSELSDATATLLRDGRVLIVGGFEGSPASYVNAWVYTP